MLTTLLLAVTLAAAGPVYAAGPIETMPLWRLQVRITTGTTATAGTNGFPALRLNATTTGVRTLNPQSSSAFDAGHVDTYDLRLLASPSQITMLRLGIAGSDDWCVKRVELLFNGRVAFARDAVPGGACASIKGGTYLEYSSADLRSNPAWTRYGAPPALPSRMSATHLRALVSDVTGSQILASTGISWNRAVPVTVTRKAFDIIKVSFGILESRGPFKFPVKISYNLRIFVGTDGRLHAIWPLSCCDHGLQVAVMGQLDAALSRMTARPAPHDPLRFGIDADTNIAWRYVPVVDG
jgi:hypothetical protein